MDTQKLIALLRATMDPNERKSAEDQLTQVGSREEICEIVLQSSQDMCSMFAAYSKLHDEALCNFGSRSSLLIKQQADKSIRYPVMAHFLHPGDSLAPRRPLEHGGWPPIPLCYL